MTVENFIQIIWTVFAKIKKCPKWLFLIIFGLILAVFPIPVVRLIYCHFAHRSTFGCKMTAKFWSSRERPKSAPYLRLKKRKRTWKCQVFSSTVPENPKVGPYWSALSGFSTTIQSQNIKLLTRKALEKNKKSYFFQRCFGKSHSAENPKEDPLGFFKIHSVANHQKFEGGDFKKVSKNLTQPKLHLNFENVISELWKRYIRTLWKRYIRTLKTLYPNFEKVISELRKRYIRTLETLYPNFEKVISELRKRYIRTLETLYPNFENVISELRKRHIRTLKTLYPNFVKTLHPNFENAISELWKSYIRT